MNNDKLVTKIRGGIPYQYDPETKRFYNPQTGKWVTNPVEKKTRIQSERFYYSHPKIDQLLEEHFENEALRQSIGCVLKYLVVRLRAKLSRSNKGKYTSPGKYYEDTWFDSQLYITLLGPTKYKAIMNKLVNLEILDVRTINKFGWTFSYYKFHERDFLYGGDIKRVKLAMVDKKCQRYSLWVKKNTHLIVDKVMDQIINNFGRFDLTHDQFMEIWMKRYAGYRESKIDMSRIHAELSEEIKDDLEIMSPEEYEQAGDLPWQVIEDWNLSSPQTRKETMHADDFGNRLHYPITYLPSEARHYILDSKENPTNLIAFDLSCAQPTLFANLLVTEHQIPLSDPFVKAVSEQRVYEDLASKLGVIRNTAKTEMMHYLYCTVPSRAQKQFSRLYPVAAKVAASYKNQDFDLDGIKLDPDKKHVVLVQKMQRAETEIFYQIWAQCMRDGIEFLPVHDAIYINKKGNDIKYLKSMMDRIIKDYIKINFKISYKVI